MYKFESKTPFEKALNISEMESQASKEIKILAEVEKLWILYDLDGSGMID